MMNSPENEQTRAVAVESGTGNGRPDLGLSASSEPRPPAQISFNIQASEAESMVISDYGQHDDKNMAHSHVQSPVSWISHHLGRAPIAMICFLIFSVFTATGIGVAIARQTNREQDIHHIATALANEAGQSLSEQFEKAIMPLYSMAKFAAHMSEFHDLPSQIAPLPVHPAGVYYRNVTEVCTDPTLVDAFVDIATDAKEHAGTYRALANIQFAPYGVLCLVHPWNNTEDFDEGEFLDSTPVFGMDLLNDPFFGPPMRESMKRGEVNLSGPRVLVQCTECGAFYIARLPVTGEDNEILMDGEYYPRWGFITVLINWRELVEESQVHDRHADHDFEFQLTRTDLATDPSTGESIEKEVLLTSSAGFELGKDQYGYVTTYVDTVDGEWKLVVAYDHAEIVRSTVLVVTTCVFISIFISGLVYIVLRERRIQATMLVEKLAKETRVNTERNVTNYFAHELRNPLSALDCALQCMKQEELPGSSKEPLDGMELCSSFMSSVMNTLVDSRKLEDGTMKLRSSPMSLSAFIDDCHKMMESSIRPGVAFLVRKDIPPGHDWVLGDKHRIQQVLTNVLTNAIKYTLDGSITLAVSWESGVVQLECIDTGPGIPLSEQERMFERFVQRGGAPGTGLGLNIAKNIVDMMEGTINFISDPTVKPGTTCRIRLPLELCEKPNVVDEYSEEGVIQQEISILIVDDVKMNLVMLDRRIKKGIAPNANITLAETGEQALEFCNENDFDIIICDQYMEEAGGVLVGTETIKVMRRNYVPSFIVGCSGNDLDDRFYDAGADAFWGKPMPNNAEIIRQLRAGLSFLQSYRRK